MNRTRSITQVLGSIIQLPLATSITMSLCTIVYCMLCMSDTTKVACMLPLILDDTFNHVSVCVLEQSLISIFVFHFIPFQRVQISYNPLPRAVGKYNTQPRLRLCLVLYFACSPWKWVITTTYSFIIKWILIFMGLNCHCYCRSAAIREKLYSSTKVKLEL